VSACRDIGTKEMSDIGTKEMLLIDGFAIKKKPNHPLNVLQ
jgi:hypothetical protein